VVCLVLIALIGESMRLQSFEEIRQGSAEAKRHFLETELSLVSTFIDLARGRYQRGNRHDGEQSKAHARETIETVRRFIGTADLSPAVTALFARRCNELERAIAAVTDCYESGPL